jgi:low temperature requirement protein LtrA
MQLSAAVALLGGPALYLGGNVFFKRASAKYYPLSHLVGLGLLAVISPFALLFTPLALGAATTAVLITVAIWETRSFASGTSPAAVEHSA